MEEGGRKGGETEGGRREGEEGKEGGEGETGEERRGQTCSEQLSKGENVLSRSPSPSTKSLWAPHCDIPSSSGAQGTPHWQPGNLGWGVGAGGLRQALGLVFNYYIKHLLCHSRSDSILPLRYLILLPSRERAKQVFLLICTLNILVIKQHLRKPIVKSILIGTKISQVVELQLREGASGASGHKVLRSQQGEWGGGADFSVRQTRHPLSEPQFPHPLNGDNHSNSQRLVWTKRGHIYTVPGNSRCPKNVLFLPLSQSLLWASVSHSHYSKKGHYWQWRREAWTRERRARKTGALWGHSHLEGCGRASGEVT